MKLVTVRTFDNSAEAHAARDFLDQAGIQAVVADEGVAGQLWHIGAFGGIQLQVDSLDLERAQTLLADDSADGSPAPWRCTRCREVIEADFDVCWSCGADRDSAADANFDPHAVTSESADVKREEFDTPTDSSAQSNDSASENPYAPSLVPATRDEELQVEPANEEIEATVLRAWRAAIIGLCVCPGVLHVLSLCWLIHVGLMGQQLSPAGARRYLGAVVVDLLVLGFGGMIAFKAFTS